MLTFLKSMIHDFVRPSSVSLIERWAATNANRATPDDIIAASIIQSFAKDFDDWTHTVGTTKKIDDERANIKDQFSPDKFNNSKKKITVFIQRLSKSRDKDGLAPWVDLNAVEVSVDGIELSSTAGKRLYSAWTILVTQRQEAEAVAAKAKADMDRNEQAWNLVEKLLGMKRNEFGALVPVKTVEG